MFTYIMVEEWNASRQTNLTKVEGECLEEREVTKVEGECQGEREETKV